MVSQNRWKHSYVAVLKGLRGTEKAEAKTRVIPCSWALVFKDVLLVASKHHRPLPVVQQAQPPHRIVRQHTDTSTKELKQHHIKAGSRAERQRKKKQGQRDREAKRGMGTRTVGYKQGVGREIAERVRSREAERMTERKRREGRGAGQRDGERKNRDRGIERQREGWGPGRWDTNRE